MCWTLSKPSTMGGGRSVCLQDLGLVNTISLDLDRLSLRLLVLRWLASDCKSRVSAKRSTCKFEIFDQCSVYVNTAGCCVACCCFHDSF